MLLHSKKIHDLNAIVFIHALVTLTNFHSHRTKTADCLMISYFLVSKLFWWQSLVSSETARRTKELLQDCSFCFCSNALGDNGVKASRILRSKSSGLSRCWCECTASVQLLELKLRQHFMAATIRGYLELCFVAQCDLLLFWVCIVIRDPTPLQYTKVIPF